MQAQCRAALPSPRPHRYPDALHVELPCDLQLGPKTKWSQDVFLFDVRRMAWGSNTYATLWRLRGRWQMRASRVHAS